MTKLPLLLFGEVLYDCFPNTQPVLGGAPLNVAWHLQGFGENPQLISAVGKDELGQNILSAMQDWGLSTEHVAIHDNLPTGVVNVTIDNGEPHYDIAENRAYDEIPVTAKLLQLLTQPAVFYHGSLAIRNPISASGLAKIKNNKNLHRFVDVNLRSPWWQAERVLDSLNYAAYVKLNHHELTQLVNQDSPHQQINNDNWLAVARDFKTNHNIVHLLVTRGEYGATLIDSSGEQLAITPPQSQAPVVDTVGAGDAFAAVMLLGYLNDWDLTITMERAQDFANYIVTQRGAICTNPATYRDFQHLWNIV